MFISFHICKRFGDSLIIKERHNIILIFLSLSLSLSTYMIYHTFNNNNNNEIELIKMWIDLR